MSESISEREGERERERGGGERAFAHVACCCVNIVSYLFPKYGRNEAKKREVRRERGGGGRWGRKSEKEREPLHMRPVAA